MLDICDSDPERKGRDMGMSLGRERPLQWSGWMFTGGCTGRVRGVSSLVYPFGFGIVLFVCIHIHGCTYTSIPAYGNMYFYFLELNIAFLSFFFLIEFGVFLCYLYFIRFTTHLCLYLISCGNCQM